ncbi:flagellar hook-length control protein FliK [Alteromonas sp. S015]|uniref:flagellar hook-length control protein FliK n=1 Tax=Alteromonas sp. S015 TaxID=3117401 RepID=UPI002FE1ABF9
MQQVAAHKTDIAALPFSASSTAKAVETGIGTQQDASGENNQAFNRLYQEAKSRKSDFVLNEKESLRTQPRETKSSSSPSSNNTSVSGKTAESARDRDAEHTTLATEKVETDIPASASEKDNANLPIDESEDNADKTSVTNALLNEESGTKDAESDINAEQGASDAKSENDESEQDWVAYVETVASRFGKGDQVSDDSDTNIGMSLIADEAASVLSVKERGKLWKLPDDIDASNVQSVMAHLLSQLNGDSSNDEFSIESLSTEAQQTLSALTTLLLGANAGSNKNADDSEANTELSMLITQLMQQAESAGNGERGVGEGTEAASELDGILIDVNNPADESFVLSLISDALKERQELPKDEAALQAEALLAEMTAENANKGSGNVITEATGTGKTTSSDKATVTNTQDTIPQGVGSGTSGEATAELLTAMNELSPQSAQKATEAFAERVVAGMPSGSQQQAVKTNIIAGINEFQEQIQQGREPGIDLSSIVADAAKDAAVSTEAIASMTARLDSQASQFLNLMTQAQGSAQQTFASMVGQTDTVIQENTQLRAEASKSQQQFEGFDKAVNIHKPEGQQQLNEKIRWMVNARNTMAEIRLDPPELGSMQVRVNVVGDAASVSFVVQSQQAKDALADSMPKLREMLSEQGIELGDAQVRKDNSSGNESGQQLADNSNRSSGGGNRGENDDLDEIDGARIIEQSISRAAKGGIDFYA